MEGREGRMKQGGKGSENGGEEDRAGGVSEVREEQRGGRREGGRGPTRTKERGRSDGEGRVRGGGGGDGRKWRRSG